MTHAMAAISDQQSLMGELPTLEDGSSCSLQRGAPTASFSDEDELHKLRLLVASSSKFDQSIFYDVIHFGNTEILTSLMQKIEVAAADDGCGPQMQRLQDAYVELKLKNVPLAPDMQMSVEQKLVDHYFFCEKNRVTMQEVAPTAEDVRHRVELTLQLVEVLSSQYSEGNLDQQFAFLGRSVAQNLHILRRQMKGTYDVLPWDEMLFCLVTFISCIGRMQDFESFYCLVLDRNSVLHHLTNFAESLSNVDLEKKDWQKKKMASSRSRIIENVVKTKPTFEALYKDFEIVKNIYSLKRILKYVKPALAVEVRSQGAAGALAIQRALQVLGECLKSTPDSPHVSADVHGALGAHAPRSARETLTALRNLLSHAYSLAGKLRLERIPDFFYSLQGDLRKIEVEITVILGKKRLEAATHFLKKLLRIDSFDELKRMYKSVRHLGFAEIDEVIKSTAEVELMKDLLRQLKDEIGDETKKDKLILKNIKEIIKSRERRQIVSTNHVYNFSGLLRTIQCCPNISIFKEFCLNLLNEITESQESSLKLHSILSLLVSLSAKQPGQPSTGKSSRTHRVYELCYRIFCVLSFEETRIKGIETLNDDLMQTETVSEDEIEKMIREVFLKVERRLVSEDGKIDVKKALDSQKQVFENKLKLLDLCNGSVPDLESFVSLTKTMNFKPRIVKELENKYKEGKFDECKSKLNIVVVEYESFARTLSKGHTLSFKYYDEALDAFFRASKLEERLRSEVLLIVEDLKAERKREISNYYEERLILLKSLFDCEKWEKLHLVDGGDQVRAAVEMLVLDLTEVLDSNDLLADSRLLYDEYSLVLIGKNLRNYLAHGDALADILPFDPATAVACTASKLILEGKDLVSRTDALIGRRTVFNLKKLKETQDKCQRIITKQNDMFAAARDDNLERLEEAIRGGADIQGRDLTGGTGLHFAARRNSVKTFTKLLELNQNVTTKDKYGRTPTHIAFVYGSLHIVQLLEDKKLFNPDHDQIIALMSSAAENGHHVLINKMLQHKSVTEIDLSNPFCTSICMGHKEVVDVMLKSGLNLKAVTKASFPPLHLAAAFGHKELVILFLENSAEVDAVNERNWTALSSAAWRGSTESALVLLDWGANINASANYRMTPLLLALQEGHADCALALLEKNADINCRNDIFQTALHYAADGLEKVVEVLLDKGSKVDELTKSKHSALYIASKGGHDRIVTALIKREANIHCRTSKSLSALHTAALHGHKSVIEVLLKNGARVSDQTDLGWTALHMAAKGGHKDAVETLLKYGADIEEEGNEHQNALHLAALNGHTEVAQVLVKSGARLNATAKDNLTALHLAVVHGHEEVLDLLLQQGADVSAVANNHHTALHMAAEYGHTTIARKLIDKGVPIDALTKTNYTALYLAVREEHKNVVDLLLKKKANIKTPVGVRETPLILAARQGNKDIAAALLQKQQPDDDHREENAKALDLAAGRGYKDIVMMLISRGRADVNFSNGLIPPIYSAAINGHSDVISVLLDNNADINARGLIGGRALHAAAENGHIDVVRILLSRQADVNATSDAQCTALHVAAFCGHGEVVQALVENNADVEAKTVKGVTALYVAASKGFRDIVELLVRSGANVESLNHQRRTALHAAAGKGHSDVVRVLLDNDANIFTFSGDNSTALHLATYNGHLEVVRIIIEFISQKTLQKNHNDSANYINIPSNSGPTPLHLAAGNGHEHIVKLLLQSGANVNAVSKNNESVLHWAVKGNHVDIVRILLKAGIDADIQNTADTRAVDFAALGGHAAVVEELLRHGVDIFFRGNKKITILHTAVMSGKECCVNVLLKFAKENCEDALERLVNSQDQDGWTGLHLAAQNGHEEIVSLLLQNSAEVDAVDCDSWTALHVAARNGREEVVARLLTAGADVQAQIGDGATPLHLASVSGFVNIVESLLVSVKANKPEQLYTFVNHRDIDGCTALHLAKRIGRTDIVQLLQHYEKDGRGLILKVLCDNFFRDKKY